MPGIAGIIGKRTQPRSSQMVEAMVASMRHERFYTSGSYIDEEGWISIGWTALERSAVDCLPIRSERSDILLIFTGEVFPEQKDLDLLRSAGHEFNAEDTSYLVHLYEERGADFVRDLNGWFAGVLVDRRLQKAFLFNDRFGAQRIYFHESDDAFYFASEAKALLKVLPGSRQLDSRGFADLLSCNCVLQDRTLFTGLSLVPGGSLWTFSRDSSPKREVYFKRETWEAQPELDEAQYYEKFKATWARVLARCFRPGERAALSLTGGVDSRMMLAWMRAEPGSVPCYTWGSMYRECNDVRLARRIAHIFGQPHQTIPLGESFLRGFPQYAEKAVYISDGLSDVTGAMDLYLQGVAREIAPIRLTGGNGGELLRRKVVFKPSKPFAELFKPEVLDLSHDVEQGYRSELQGNRVTFCAFKQVPWFMSRTFSLERSQITLRTPYLDNDLVAVSYQAPPGSLGIAFALKLASEGEPALSCVPTDRGITLSATPGTKKLRHLWQQGLFKAEYAFDSGMPQWLAKINHGLGPLRFDKIMAGHHKSYHFRLWSQNELAGYVKEILLDPRTLGRPYLNHGAVEKLVRTHLSGLGNFTYDIIRLLSIELLHRSLLERV